LLEHQFKAQLFARHCRGLELAPAGEHLLQPPRGVIADELNTRAEIANYGSGRQAAMGSDNPLRGPEAAFAHLMERDLFGLEGSSTPTLAMMAQAAAAG
jgi:hypothetical protein